MQKTHNIRTAFRSASTLRGQLTNVRDQDPLGSCVPDPFKLQSCIYGGNEESPQDPHKGAQSCHQTGRGREVSHNRACLGTAAPSTVGGDQCVENNTTLLIKEALHIHLTNLELIHRDKGVTIPECWQLVLDHATMMSTTHATPCRETEIRVGIEETKNHEH